MTHHGNYREGAKQREYLMNRADTIKIPLSFGDLGLSAEQFSASSRHKLHHNQTLMDLLLMLSYAYPQSDASWILREPIKRELS